LTGPSLCVISLSFSVILEMVDDSMVDDSVVVDILAVVAEDCRVLLKGVKRLALEAMLVSLGLISNDILMVGITVDDLLVALENLDICKASTS
jgi:c-di-GMP-related signal transduction protein